jgi:hypothetical protein
MTAKRIFGYILIVISIILALAIIGQIQSLFTTVYGLFKIFTGTFDGYQSGLILGNFLYWLLHFTLTIVLWNYGRKWSRKVDNINLNIGE